MLDDFVWQKLVSDIFSSRAFVDVALVAFASGAVPEQMLATRKFLRHEPLENKTLSTGDVILPVHSRGINGANSVESHLAVGAFGLAANVNDNVECKTPRCTLPRHAEKDFATL